MKMLLILGTLTFGLTAFASGGGGGGQQPAPLSDLIETKVEKEVVKTKTKITLTEKASLELMDSLNTKSLKGKIKCEEVQVAACGSCDAFVVQPVCTITTQK